MWWDSENREKFVQLNFVCDSDGIQQEDFPPTNQNFSKFSLSLIYNVLTLDFIHVYATTTAISFKFKSIELRCMCRIAQVFLLYWWSSLGHIDRLAQPVFLDFFQFFDSEFSATCSSFFDFDSTLIFNSNKNLAEKGWDQKTPWSSNRWSPPDLNIIEKNTKKHLNNDVPHYFLGIDSPYSATRGTCCTI